MSHKYPILIHSNYRPDTKGGIEAVVSRLIGLFESHGISVKCFCGNIGPSGKSLHKGQTVIYRRVLTKIAGAPLLSFGNCLFLWHSRKARLLIYQEPFPFLWPSVVILRLFYRTPTIVLVHANPSANKFIKKIYGVVRSFVFRNAILVTTSPNLLDKVSSPSYARMHLVPLSLPSYLDYPKQVLELPTRYVLYIGRFSRYKGIPILLKSIQRLPHIQFVIAGSGDFTKVFDEDPIKDRLCNLILIDRHVTEAEKCELLHRCDFVVFPSINENEAFGIVQLEAMRFGKAIVNTWIDSGVNYVAPDGVCALTVQPSDSRALAAAINTLWINSLLCQQLGKSGFERLNALFSEDCFDATWIDLVKKELDFG